jgi:hypothetical protein
MIQSGENRVLLLFCPSRSGAVNIERFAAAECGVYVDPN